MKKTKIMCITVIGGAFYFIQSCMFTEHPIFNHPEKYYKEVSMDNFSDEELNCMILGGMVGINDDVNTQLYYPLTSPEFGAQREQNV